MGTFPIFAMAKFSVAMLASSLLFCSADLATTTNQTAPRRSLGTLSGRPCGVGNDPDTYEPCKWAEEGGSCEATACRNTWGGCRAPLIGIRCHGLPPAICPVAGRLQGGCTLPLHMLQPRPPPDPPPL